MKKKRLGGFLEMVGKISFNLIDTCIILSTVRQFSETT